MCELVGHVTGSEVWRREEERRWLGWMLSFAWKTGSVEGNVEEELLGKLGNNSLCLFNR